MNIRLNISTASNNYQVFLQQTQDSSGAALKIGGIGYKVLSSTLPVDGLEGGLQGEFKNITGLKEYLVAQKINAIGVDALGTSASEAITGVSVSIVDGPKGKLIDDYLSRLQGMFQFSGAVLVESGGKRLLSKAYGKAAGARENTTQTAFQIASTSKQFTAAAILKLVDEGKVDLDKPCNLYLAEKHKSPQWEGITVRQLLSHTAKLRNNFDCKAFVAAKEAAREESVPFEPTVDELIGYFKDEPLDAPTTPYYSNNGYYLLGAIIENVAGKSYGDFVRDDLIPSDMSSTGYYDDERKSSLPQAMGHQWDEQDSILIPETLTVAAEAYSAGGLYSTVDDLAVWCDALADGRVVSKEAFGEMCKQQAGEFGLGVVLRDSFGEGTIMAPGNISGFKSVVCFNPESRDKSVLLMNNYGVSHEAVQEAIVDIVNGRSPIQFLDNTEPHPPFQAAVFGEGEQQHQFVERDGKYFVVHGEECRLAPRSNGRYLNLKYGTEWEFKEGRAICYGRDGKEVGQLTLSS